jgi:hypothetical protein
MGSMLAPQLDAGPFPRPADVADPRFAQLIDYWMQRRARKAMPARADIDPTDIPRLLPQIFLVDVGSDASDLRYRLVGTEVVRLFGMELTGHPVGTGMPEAAGRLMRARFACAARNRQPVYATGMMQADRNDHTLFQRLLLPLSKDGDRVDMLLGMMVGVSVAHLLGATLSYPG